MKKYGNSVSSDWMFLWYWLYVDIYIIFVVIYKKATLPLD